MNIVDSFCQLEQIEKVKSSGFMLELALDSQCDPSGYECNVQLCISNRHDNKQTDHFQGCSCEGSELCK